MSSATAIRLCLALRQHTRPAHVQLEGHPWLRALMAGTLERAAWQQQLADLAWVYGVLEQTMHAHAEVSALLIPALRGRAARLAEDLTILGPAPSPSTAARRYGERIRSVGDSTPRLLAHSYTRHLGDLSGGPIIARTLLRCFGDEAAAATSFHDFSAHGSPRALAGAWRDLADALVESESDIATACEEAERAFGLNAGLFDAAMGGVAP